MDDTLLSRRVPRRVPWWGAVAAALIILGGAACGNGDDGDLQLPPGPTVPDTRPFDEPDPVPTETLPGAPPGPTVGDEAPPGPGRGDPGEAPP